MKNDLDSRPVARAIRAFLDRSGWSMAHLSNVATNNQNNALVKSILKGHSLNPRGDTLAKLARAMDMTVAELTGETKPSNPPPPTNAVVLSTAQGPNLRDLPVFGSAEGGGIMILDNEPIEFKERPANLLGVRGAFAVYIVNDSMAPAYEAGDQVHIHPGRPVKPGKDALFISQDEHGVEHVMVKRLAKATEKVWRVQQFNPAKTFDLPRATWQRALRVVGSERSD